MIEESLCFGPWMIAKNPQCKYANNNRARLARGDWSYGELKEKSGSQFDVLVNEREQELGGVVMVLEMIRGRHNKNVQVDCFSELYF